MRAISALMTNSNFVACMTGRNGIFGGKIFDPRQLFLVDHASHIGQDAPNPFISPRPSGCCKTVAREIRRGYAGDAQIPFFLCFQFFDPTGSSSNLPPTSTLPMGAMRRAASIPP